jgi:hypothetical protein
MSGFQNPDNDQIKELIQSAKTVAVVGLSSNESRDSHAVAKYLQENGFRIVPVNPKEDEILGEKSYPSLRDIPEKVDIVDVFRRSEFVPEIADQAIEIKAKALWLQQGVTHDEAAKRAQDSGLTVVQDQCLKVKHHKLMK